MNKYIHFLLLLLIPVLGHTQKTTKKCFRLPAELKEVSGLYLENENSFWWLNDGGWAPILYNSNGKGNIIDSIVLNQIKNVDWEELTSDDKGNLYIGDFGNNLNKRQNLRIYIYNKQKALLDSIQFSYPDQAHFPPSPAQQSFDMEACFWHNETLHLFSKNRMGAGNYYTKHYTLSDQPGEQVAILKDSLYLKKRVVTAASISPDGKTVAMMAYNYKRILGFLPTSAATIFILRDFEGDNFFKGRLMKRKAPGFILATQWESLDYLDYKRLFVASEQTAFIRPKAKRVKLRKRHWK